MNKNALDEARRRRVTRLEIVMTELVMTPPDYEFAPEEKAVIEDAIAALTRAAAAWRPPEIEAPEIEAPAVQERPRTRTGEKSRLRPEKGERHGRD